ncbi:DNA topoisomerase III [Aliivibrio fischeri]|uniref:DNA topoisomerase n=1 Tax=Aliivibrio fischeri TaxID=668 RepID=UPI0012DA628F|nr:DNA topoisomerase [Aliivibrio fischeri]MUK94765.1 DNA topoisomerase III [Aliivibrio fischeri]
MVNLYLAEKPSLARALFLGLGGNENLIKSGQRQGFYQYGDHIVTYCFGHMLELLNPEEHDEKYKKWDLNLLPMRFEPKLKVKDDAKSQYSVIQQLLKKADVIYNVGDPDEEGQLLIDEIITYERITKPVKRIFISDMNLNSVKKSIANASDNQRWLKNGLAALARSICDQAWGFNLTRAYTVAGRQKGHDRMFNIGRVQTAAVNIVNERCLAIENHVKSYFFDIYGEFNINGLNFTASYEIKDSDPVDDNGKINHKAFAESIIEKCIDEPAIIEKAKHKDVNKNAPMPYSLSTLQGDCARKFGLSAKETLDTIQSLYEKHKVLTYPRSNAKYLSNEHHAASRRIISAISQTNPIFKQFADKTDLSLKHKCFNDDKFDNHHGIIPTETSCDFSKLSATEQNIYNLVARSFIALFYPPSVYAHSEITVKVADLQFHTETEKKLSNGWKELYTNDKGNPDIDESLEGETALSSLKLSMQGTCEDVQALSKETAPPKYFVGSTFIRELTRAALKVTDPELKKIFLKKFEDEDELGAIGTEATRADMIEKCFETGFLRKGKLKGYKEEVIVTSDMAKEFLALLPFECKAVDTTAQWIAWGEEIKKGNLTVTQYVDRIYEQINKQVAQVKKNGLNIKVNLTSCPTCFDGYLKKITTEKNTFFSCTRYPECNASFPEYKGNVYIEKHNCPKCGSALILRKTKDDYWFGCSGFKENGCKQSMGCVGGKPVKKAQKRRSFSTKK